MNLNDDGFFGWFRGHFARNCGASYLRNIDSICWGLVFLCILPLSRKRYENEAKDYKGAKFHRGVRKEFFRELKTLV